MFNGRLKVRRQDKTDTFVLMSLQVTVCAAKDLQRTNFMSRHDGVFDEKKEKAKPDVDPYVMIGERENNGVASETYERGRPVEY